MPTVNIELAQANLAQIVDDLIPGETLTITRDGKPVASLSRTPLQQWPCKAGSAKHRDHWMAPDFNEALEEFKEYME